MTFTPEVVIAAIVQLTGFGAMWGHQVASQAANRKRQDERHAENHMMLKDISADVKRINGTVRELGVTSGDHERRIGRIEDRR